MPYSLHEQGCPVGGLAGAHRKVHDPDTGVCGIRSAAASRFRRKIWPAFSSCLRIAGALLRAIVEFACRVGMMRTFETGLFGATQVLANLTGCRRVFRNFGNGYDSGAKHIKLPGKPSGPK